MESPPVAETRRSRRVPEANPILVAIPSEDYQVRHEAFTMDRSRHGLGIRTRVHLSPGETIVIIHLGGSRSDTAPARVVWVGKPKSSDAYAAGLECLSLSAA
jgi:PilZ domain